MSEVSMGEPSRTAVLGVDDTPANLVALGAVVAPLGIEFVTASSGEAALELASARDFAVIVLDMMMPGLDGLATLERLRQLPNARTTPVIFLTAFDMNKKVIARAYTLGAVDYVTKPVDPDILAAKLRAFVALHEQAEAIRKQAAALVAKDRYIGILAHDLGTPITAIKLTASRMRKHADGAVQAMGERIERSVGRMERLTDDVLGFARVATGNLRVRAAPMDLCELCRELLTDFADVHPEVRFEADLPAQLSGTWDRERLQQALSNLIGNAVKYGTGWVAVSAHRSNGSVVIEITNSGEPIPEEWKTRLFKPFERGQQTQRGVGLGLYIVREIARAHAGDVEVDSAEARTAFRVVIPVS